MSENPPSAEAERAPTEPYVEMPSAEPLVPKRIEFTAERDGLESAAKEVSQAREANAPPPPPPSEEHKILRRLYEKLSGEKAPAAEKSLDVESAALDLQMMRQELEAHAPYREQI